MATDACYDRGILVYHVLAETVSGGWSSLTHLKSKPSEFDIGVQDVPFYFYE